MKKQLVAEMLKAKTGDHIKITAIHPESAFKEDEKCIVAQKEFKIWECHSNLTPVTRGYVMLEVEVLEDFQLKSEALVEKGDLLSIYGVKFNLL